MEDWLEKIVEHKTPTGRTTRVKVKSLSPKEQEKYRPKENEKQNLVKEPTKNQQPDLQQNLKKIKNIQQTIKNDEPKDPKDFDNWIPPSKEKLQKEFKIEHELKRKNYFNSESDFLKAVEKY